MRCGRPSTAQTMLATQYVPEMPEISSSAVPWMEPRDPAGKSCPFIGTVTLDEGGWRSTVITTPHVEQRVKNESKFGVLPGCVRSVPGNVVLS